ncbi:MAG TPA: hypothetical protein PLT70_09705, partial [bacterium]|nr:hypothetical protein [bacterium]
SKTPVISRTIAEPSLPRESVAQLIMIKNTNMAEYIQPIRFSGDFLQNCKTIFLFLRSFFSPADKFTNPLSREHL